MEKGFQRISMENQRDSEFQGLPASEGVVSPIYNANTGRRRYAPLLDPYASDSSNSPSSLVKRRSSADPEAKDSSSHAFSTPVKVEEDVIIMDGISVPRSNKGGGQRRMSLPMPSYNSFTSSFGRATRFSSTSSPSGGGERRMSLPMPSYNSVPSSFGRAARFSSTSSPSEGGGRGSWSTDRSKYEKQVCRYWEISGTCRNGNHCQFAHGHEIQELFPLTPRGKRTDIEISKLSLEDSSPSSHGKDFPPLTPSKAAVHSKAEGESLLEGSNLASYYKEFPPLTPSKAAAKAKGKAKEEAFSFPSVPTTMDLPSPLLQFKDTSTIPRSTIPDTANEVKQLSGGTIPISTIPVVIAPPNPAVIAPRNEERWSPEDSGIQVSLPHAPAETNPFREDVDAYIEEVLYGASSRERLPVFKEICPDSPD